MKKTLVWGAFWDVREQLLHNNAWQTFYTNVSNRLLEDVTRWHGRCFPSFFCFPKTKINLEKKSLGYKILGEK